MKIIIYDGDLNQEIQLEQDFICSVDDVGCFFDISYEQSKLSWRMEQRRNFAE